MTDLFETVQEESTAVAVVSETSLALRDPKMEVAIKEKVIPPIVLKANEFQVSNESDNARAAEFIREIKKGQKQVIKLFKNPKEKANEAHKAVIASEKLLLDPLEEAEKTVKDRVSEYITKLAEIRIENERKMREEEARIAEEIAKENARIEEEARKAEEVGDKEKQNKLKREAEIKEIKDRQDAEARQEEATMTHLINTPAKTTGVYTTTTWTWEVENLADVPREYLIVNEKMLNGIAKSTKGSIKVPGIKFVPKTGISARA